MTERFSAPSPQLGTRSLDASASAVIHTLAYFSLFRHPLDKGELAKYLHFWRRTGQDLDATLGFLTRLGLIGISEGFYFLAGQESLVAVRKKRTAVAQQWSKKVRTSAQVLAWIPFVRAVALSGSLSKGTQEAEGDIDFLLLTQHDRLWTSQFFLSIFQKILPPSERRKYCANLLLPSNHLSVQSRNLFTATEIVFLRPLMNGSLCDSFFRENAWVEQFYPQWKPSSDAVPEPSTNRVKTLVEWAFSGKWGDRFESGFSKWMARRVERRRKRHSRFSGHPPQLESTHEEEVVHHSRARQWHLQREWRAALDEFQSRHGVRLVQWQWSSEDEFSGSRLQLTRKARNYSHSVAYPAPSH